MKTTQRVVAVVGAIASVMVLVVVGAWWLANVHKRPLYAVTVSTLLPQPFTEVKKQPEIEQLRTILANPTRNPRIGHAPQVWGLQVVGETLPSRPTAFTCFLSPKGELIEIGSLGGGLVVAEYRTSNRGDGFCNGGEAVIAREVWFETA